MQHSFCWERLNLFPDANERKECLVSKNPLGEDFSLARVLGPVERLGIHSSLWGDRPFCFALDSRVWDFECWPRADHDKLVTLLTLDVVRSSADDLGAFRADRLVLAVLCNRAHLLPHTCAQETSGQPAWVCYEAQGIEHPRAVVGWAQLLAGPCRPQGRGQS